MTAPVRHLRAAGGESVIVQGALRLVAAVRAGCAEDLHRQAVVAQPDAIHERLAGSRAGRAAAAIIDVAERTWSGSRLYRVVVTAAGAVRMLTGVQFVRVAGIWLLTAAATDLALTPFDPRPVSVSRWALWALCVVLGSAAAVWAKPAHAAWLEWRQTR